MKTSMTNLNFMTKLNYNLSITLINRLFYREIHAKVIRIYVSCMQNRITANLYAPFLTCYAGWGREEANGVLGEFSAILLVNMLKMQISFERIDLTFPPIIYAKIVKTK